MTAGKKGCLLALVLAVSACKATIPEGVIACDGDSPCPQGFSCRAEGSDPGLYCFSEADSEGVQKDAGADDGGGRGADSALDSALDSGGEGGMDSALDSGGDGGTEPVQPTSASFSTLGGRRSGGPFTLYDDGFEGGERLCTGTNCVTGSFSP